MTTEVGDRYLTEVESTDPEIYGLIKAEEQYQVDTIRLIPSENYTSRAVMEATGSVLANKYSEGYPGKRYYEGQRYIDQLETLVQRSREGAVRRRARERAAVLRLAGEPRRLLRAAGARRQDHGAGAAARRPPHARLERQRHRPYFWTSVRYEVDPKTHLIDYDRVREIALAERPKIIVAGATAYPARYRLRGVRRDREGGRRATSSPTSRTSAGLIVAGVHPDPDALRRRRDRRRRTRRCAARAAR